MCHPFFDDLRVPDVKMASGKEMPPLFNFTKEGESTSPLASGALADERLVELSIRPDLMSQLVPKHCEAELLSRGIDVNNFVPIPLADMRITLD